MNKIEESAGDGSSSVNGWQTRVQRKQVDRPAGPTVQTEQGIRRVTGRKTQTKKEKGLNFFWTTLCTERLKTGVELI